jgi:preprotein translocase subunit YajC
MFDMHLPLVLAQAGGGASSLTGLMVPMVGVLAIMYFVIFRPQQAEAKKLQETISSLKKGDDVVTSGGLLGKVFMVADKTLTLEIASGVKVRVLKSAIAARGSVSDEPAKVAAGDDAKKIDEAKKEEK